MEFVSTYSVHSEHFGRVLSHFLRRFLHNKHDRVAKCGGRLPGESVISESVSSFLELTRSSSGHKYDCIPGIRWAAAAFYHPLVDVVQ